MQQEVRARWSDENIIDLIQKLRDNYIKVFLDERYLKEHAQSKFSISEISNIKLQFIKRDIKELLTSPIDLNYYEPMISEIRKNDTANLHQKNVGLFLQLINQILIKYIF